MPGAAILHDRVPAEGIPIRFRAFLAVTVVQQVLERHLFVTTRKLIPLLQLILREARDDVNVLDRADRQALYVHIVQWITAVDAAAVLVTRLVMLETDTAVGVTASLAVAVVFFFHNLISLRVLTERSFLKSRLSASSPG